MGKKEWQEKSDRWKNKFVAIQKIIASSKKSLSKKI